MAESTTATASVTKRLAIVGAGPSGLVALRWSLARGLQPTAFECAAAVGGVWNLRNYALSPPYRWPSNNTNTSKFALTFSGVEHPTDSPMFPSKQQMNAYIGRYADHFELTKFVRFRHLVTRIEVLPIENADSLMGAKWTVHFRRLDDGVEGSETFDFLIVAAGIAGKPYIPAEFLSKLTGPNAHFRGQFFHCPGNAPAEWDYEMENQQSDRSKIANLAGQIESKTTVESAYAGKHVWIIGSSHTATDILMSLVGHADARLNATRAYMLRRKHYWLLPKFQPFVRDGPTFPIELHDWRRHGRKTEFEELFKSPQETLANHIELEFNAPNQNSLACGKFGLDKAKDYVLPVYASIVDPEFLRVADRIGERLEVVEGDSVFEIREKSILLESGRELPCDVIVFTTGFDISYPALMPQEVLKAIDYNPNDHYFPVILYKSVLHPRVNTLAILNSFRCPPFYQLELQARWATLVFSGQLPPPDPSDQHVLSYMDEMKCSRALGPTERPQMPHWDMVGYADELAREIGALPDWRPTEEEDMRPTEDPGSDESRNQKRVKEPWLRQALEHGPLLPGHYFLVGPDALADRAAQWIHEQLAQLPGYPLDGMQ